MIGGFDIASPSLSPVAVKLDHGELPRFEREVALLRRLAHPNLVTMLAHGTEQGNGETLRWIALERADESLQDRLERAGPIPFREALGYFYDALRFLQHCHDQHVVHRDIKPGNLLIWPGTAKVCDLGLGFGWLDERLTSTNVRVGTPLFMPRRAMDGQAPAAWHDLFALGRVLVVAVTTSGNYSAEAFDVMLTRFRHLPEVPDRIYAIVAAMTDERDHVHPSSAAEVWAWLNDETDPPVPPRPPGPESTRMIEVPGRPRDIPMDRVVLGVLIALAIVAGMLITGRAIHLHEPASSRLTAEAVRVREVPSWSPGPGEPSEPSRPEVAIPAPVRRAHDLVHDLHEGPIEDRLLAARELIALGLGSDVVASFLIGLLKDPRWGTRAAAAKVLGEMSGTQAGVAALIRRLDDEHRCVRRMAAVSLCDLGPKGLPEVEAALIGGSSKLRRIWLCYVLHKNGIRRSTSFDVLHEYITDPSSEVRWDAARAIGALGKPEVSMLRILVRGVRHDNWQAALSIADIEGDVSEAVPALIRALRGGRSRVMRAAAREVLCRIVHRPALSDETKQKITEVLGT